MVIGSDVDDCLTKTTQAFCYLAKKLFGIELNLKQLCAQSVKFEDLRLISPSQVAEIKMEYYRLRLFKNINSYSHIKNFLKLTHFNKVYFITSRDDYDKHFLMMDTMTWLKRRGAKNFEVIFNKDKSHEINRLGITDFIEDNPIQIHNIIDTTQAKVIMPERPWNSIIKPNNRIVKVKNLNEIYLKLNNDDNKN